MNPMTHQRPVLNRMPSGAPVPGYWFVESLHLLNNFILKAMVSLER